MKIRIIKKHLLTWLMTAFFLLSGGKTCVAQAVAEKLHFEIDRHKSRLTFFLKGNVHDTLGSPSEILGGASAFILPDGILKDPAVTIKINTAELDTNDKARDKRMKKKFLEVKKYPEIRFDAGGMPSPKQTLGRLSGATKEKPLTFDLEGRLSIHGVTKQIILEISAYPLGDGLVVEGSTTLILQDYNIKNPSFLFFRTENEVKIDFHIELFSTVKNIKEMKDI